MTKNKRITRRDALKVGAIGVISGLAACSPLATATEVLIPTAAPLPTNPLVPSPTTSPNTTGKSQPVVAPTEGPTVSTLINDIANAATRYLESLDKTQRAKSTQHTLRLAIDKAIVGHSVAAAVGQSVINLAVVVGRHAQRREDRAPVGR